MEAVKVWLLVAVGLVLTESLVEASQAHHDREKRTVDHGLDLNSGPNNLEVDAACGPECHYDFLGVDYRGRRSVTMSGYTCQAWNSQYPHEHTRNDVREFPDARYNKLNFCRNPDHTVGTGPWCYTTNPDVRWETCAIPQCADCKPSHLGNDYRGERATTAQGNTCQRWDSQYPHQHSRNDISQFPDAAYNEENFCRNPDHEPEGPWCYTTDPDIRWEYCGVPQCTECKTTVEGSEYRGTRSVTISGRTCQRWDSQTPHEHTRNDVSEFPNAIYNEANYCRNPEPSDGVGPWCYTNDPLVRWEPCGIPWCQNESPEY